MLKLPTMSPADAIKEAKRLNIMMGECEVTITVQQAGAGSEQAVQIPIDFAAEDTQPAAPVQTREGYLEQRLAKTQDALAEAKKKVKAKTRTRYRRLPSRRGKPQNIYSGTPRCEAVKNDGSQCNSSACAKALEAGVKMCALHVYESNRRAAQAPHPATKEARTEKATKSWSEGLQAVKKSMQANGIGVVE